MKDSNGVEVKIGDTVRFFGKFLDEDFYLGTIIGFNITIDMWEGQTENTKDVAMIVNEDPEITVWGRYSEDFYKV